MKHEKTSVLMKNYDQLLNEFLQDDYITLLRCNGDKWRVKYQMTALDVYSDMLMQPYRLGRG